MGSYARRNHKMAKIYVIIGIVFSFLLAGLFIFLFIKSFNKRSLITYPKYYLTLSSTGEKFNGKDWTIDNIVINIEDTNKIESYSFDGGQNFQDDSTFIVSENGIYSVVVKDTNGNISKTTNVKIDKIDKDAPQFAFESQTVVQLNSNFSLSSGVSVTDGKGSGLDGNYVVVPDKIDTSVEGTYTVTYTAFDKVGNYTEKQRTIIVSDVVGRTYYRYRVATVESYQCEPYACNCKTTPSAIESKTCPSGFTFNEPDKCCQTCYKTCKQTTWSDWSEWSQQKVSPNSVTEVETKVE